MLTSHFGAVENLNIHCTVEVFDDLGQLSVHFFDRPVRVDQPIYRSRCGHQHWPNPER